MCAARLESCSLEAFLEVNHESSKRRFGNGNCKRQEICRPAFELSKRHWWNLPSEAPLSFKPKKATPAITIAISRQRGALGSQIGAEAGKRLGWPVYDRQLLDMIADRAVLRTELLESIDEQDRPWLIETLTGLEPRRTRVRAICIISSTLWPHWPAMGGA